VLDACRCSGSRVERVLKALSEQEIEELRQDEDIVVVCEFCKREWRYDTAALDTLRASDGPPAF